MSKPWVESFVKALEEFYREDYDDELEFSVRKVMIQYLEKTIPRYAYRDLFAAVTKKWKRPPIVAHLQEIWIEIKDTVYPPSDPGIRKITEHAGDPYASKEEVATFLHELRTALDPDVTKEGREEALNFLKERYGT